MAEEKTRKQTFSMKLDAEVASQLSGLLDEAEGDRNEVVRRLMPAIEAALAVEMPPSLLDDMQAVRLATRTIESRMNAMAATYASVEEDAEKRYKDTLVAQVEEVRQLKEEVEERDARIAELEGELEAAVGRAEEMEKAVARLESEREGWLQALQEVRDSFRALAEKKEGEGE